MIKGPMAADLRYRALSLDGALLVRHLPPLPPGGEDGCGGSFGMEPGYRPPMQLAIVRDLRGTSART